MTPGASFPIRTECPPGACVCNREALLQNPNGDLRVLRLTREEEKRLLQRLENLGSLSDLRRIEERLEQQLGIRLTISTSPNEVRTLRGITILVHEQTGLCKKTRQAIPAAIKKSLEQRPEIAFELLDEGGLFGGL
ncbi:MAG: hypothetical protein EKK45_11245 [Curvibacter sp.]|nr:MAG: hypothetical protein EKK45_11245 [Curvibacter sp.]